MPKIDIKKVTTWMGITYRVYINGMYMGAASSRASGAGERKTNASPL